MRRLLVSLVAIGLTACQAENVQPEVEHADKRYDQLLLADDQLQGWLAQATEEDSAWAFDSQLDVLGAQFVELALHMGRLDSNYVDAYHGPDIWKTTTDAMTPDAERLAGDIDSLKMMLAAFDSEDQSEAVRKAQLGKLLRAMSVRLKVVTGEAVAFDTEVSEIYDVTPPIYDLSKYDAVLAEIDALVPGEGDLAARVDAFRNSLAIPTDKLAPVFERAIAECRARTEAHYTLPEGETFRMEFVTDKSWSGYNYYQGGYESLIQINTDFPIIIDRAVDLGCHEGYPGHHVWNLFIEQELVGERGWIEYTVNPLFGPFGPIAEGSANFGIELAFPANEKIAFERDVLFPMAGLDPADASKLAALNALTGQLSHATNDVARRYLDGDITREEAVPLIQRYYLASLEKSAQRVSFIDTYRGYVINYNIGRDLAREWVDAAGDDTAARWGAFEAMLTGPVTASDIVAARD
ncbi:MAG: hypothetical protein ABJG15_00720 [Hyphomonadaceae bacterium]